MSQLKAPNGKPSNLTPEQWKLVRTPQFKAWFGDWENDPENASKVVDENGEPLVVYHNSRSEKKFSIFIERPTYFSNLKNYNPTNGKIAYECFLQIKKPYKPKDKIHRKFIDEQLEGIKRKFDGVIGKEYTFSLDVNAYIVLKSTQIKLADGSNTTFDGNNPDIRFAKGGTTNYGIDELYEIATQKFESNGYEVTQGSNSKTDYGHSRYFYVNQNGQTKENSGLGFQVRVSDHSTGDRRILNAEQFIFNESDIDVVYNRINYWFHPEEYKNIVVVKTKVVQIEVGENDLQPSDSIISERVAKSGSKRYTIKRTYKNEGIVPTHVESGFKLPFKPNNPDIRFAEGGILPHSLHIVIENVNPEKKYFGQYKKIFDIIEEDITLYNPYGTEDEKIIGNDFHIWISPIPDNDKVEQIKKLKGVKVLSNYYAEGGKTKRYMKKIKRGGITYGKSHAEGGIPVKNQSTGDMLEVEGGEGIVNKRSMASKSRVKLNGKEMTICEAVSQLNQMEGGVKFSCEDVSDRQFIKAMAKGGELERGTRTEQEHIQVLKDLYAKRITPKQASERIAKDHLKEDSRYYSKLAKMEGKMADGGELKLNTYQQRIQTNLEAMGTSEKEWSAVPINGFENIEVNGKFKTMPQFAFPKNYQKPPTLFPNPTSGDMNCELCGKKPITTAYYIQNDSKKYILIVGSECVKHFGEGASGKENLRKFKIAEAEILNNDLIKGLEYIKNTYSKIVSERNYRGGITKSRKWSQSYVTEDYDKYYPHKVSSLVNEGKLDGLFTKGSFKKQSILWYQIIENYKPFDTAFYENYSSDKDSKILSWYKRNKDNVEEMLKSLKVFEKTTRNIDLEFDSIQNESEIKNDTKMADGGKTRKNAKKTLTEVVGFDINSIDISKL